MKIESGHSAEDRGRWKAIRLDLMTDISGEILTADEQTGALTVNVDGEVKAMNFGPGWFRLVRRQR